MTAHRLLDVAGLPFRVLESPGPLRSGRPPAVLIHGIGMSHRYLSRLHAALATRTDVVSIDLPGFGGVPKPPADVDIPTMAAALREVIATLGWEDAVLVGHSMGTQWVVEAALQQPSLTSLVVAIGPVADERHRTLGAQARALGLDTLGESPVTTAVVLADYARCGTPWYLTQLRHMLAYEMEDRVRRLTVPLLLMRGGRDPVAGREWCRRLRDEAAAARLVEVPRRHHLVQQSAPHAVASAILFHTTDAGQAALRGRTVPAGGQA